MVYGLVPPVTVRPQHAQVSRLSVTLGESDATEERSGFDGMQEVDEPSVVSRLVLRILNSCRSHTNNVVQLHWDASSIILGVDDG